MKNRYVYSKDAVQMIDASLWLRALDGDEHAIESLGCAVTVLSRSEQGRVRAAWRQAFAEHVFHATGKWTLKGFDWHAFTWGLDFPTFGASFRMFESGQRAAERYRDLGAVSCYFESARRRTPALSGASIQPPPIEGWRDDLYVTSHDFRWTFVLTHHRHHGPFFAERERPLDVGAGPAARSGTN